MHTALLANTAWLDDELATLNHVIVGLIDQQVRVAQVVPDRFPDDESSVFVQRVAWHETRWRWLNQLRLAQLADPIQAMSVDLIHALDGRLWSGALKLADRLQLPVVLSASSYLDLKEAVGLHRRLPTDRVAFTASTEPLHAALREEVDDAIPVHFVPTGIYPSQADQTQRLTTDALCAVVSGNGIYDGAYDALLEGMAQLVQRQPQSQFFFDGQDSDQHPIWRAAEARGLLPNISLIPRRLGHRELLLRADVLLHPQALGKSRTLTLQAMAVGLPIVALADPWLDYLVDGQTAQVLPQPDVSLWSSALRQLVEQPDQARSLGGRARQWVVEHRPASRQVESILALYRDLLGQPIQFPG